jgi:peroxin-10
MEVRRPQQGAKVTSRDYPFAAAPDVLRTHEKDAYLTSTLSVQASAILRSLLGARFAHRHSDTINHLTELLYLCLTTLLGNRTLGEEYCDVIQIEAYTLRLASLAQRVGYISSVVFTPWFLAKSLPALRRKLRTKLGKSIEREKQKAQSSQSRALRFQEYVLKHLNSLTSPSPVYALSLALFYFTGSYYHLSKRLFGLRYIFTRKIKSNEQRVGYEVLGVLLVLQIIVQSTLHVRQTLLENSSELAMDTNSGETTIHPTTAILDTGAEIPIGSALDGSSNHLLGSLEVPHHLPKGLPQMTQTPVLDHPRYDLSTQNVMSWIPAGQQSKCTLCLEPFRDPSVTTCGHVFCWTCIQDWVREKAECPLCRQAILPQKVLPLRS